MSGFTFFATADAIEPQLVNQFALSPLAIPSELAAMHGRWKGAPVTMTTNAYSGPAIRYARVVRVSGDGLQIVNVLAIPTPQYPLPILGIDLVSAGTPAAVVVADLSPMTTDPALRDHQHAAMRRRTSARPSLPSAGPLPEWCRPFFSPHALFARVATADTLDLPSRLLDLVDLLADLAATTAPDDAGARVILARQQAYSTTHLSDDRGLQLTRRMFDPDLADRFLSTVLFPIGAPAWL